MVESTSQPQQELLAELEQLKARRAQLQVNRDEIEAALRLYEVSLQSLQKWATFHRQSFSWRYNERMREQLAKAESDVTSQRALIEQFAVPDTGRLTAIRKRFFALTGRATLFALGYVALLGFISTLVTGVKPIFLDPLVIGVTAASGLVIAWLVALVVYYRDWSGFQRYVLVSLGRMRNAGDNVTHAQAELARLRSLHQQAQDWIELLAVAMHTPWQIRPQWLELDVKDVDAERLPFALRMAIAQEGDSASGHALDRLAAERLLRPGWRRDAFDALIDEVCRKAGLSAERFSLRELDSDLVLAGNGTRRLLRETMLDETVLARVAEPRLLDIAQEIQMRGFSISPPPVRLSREFPLETFYFDRSGISELNADQAWDEFLGEIVGKPNDPITPLSPENLSLSARVRGVHHGVHVYLEMPARLRTLPIGMPDYIKVRAHGHETVNPMDLVVRAELLGPLAPEDVSIWGANVEFESAVAVGVARVCTQCGRTECFEFLSGVECLRTGV